MTKSLNNALRSVVAQRRITDLGLLGGRLCWLEAAKDGKPRLTGWPALPGRIRPEVCASTLYGYGGGSWAGAGPWYTHLAFDGSLVRGRCDTGWSERLTVAGNFDRTYGDLSISAAGVVYAVSEESGPSTSRRYGIVTVPSGQQEPATLLSGADMYGSPRPSPNGNWVASLRWRRAGVPWLQTALMLIPTSGPVRCVPAAELGGRSVRELCWLRDGLLLVVVEGDLNRLLVLDPAEPARVDELWSTPAELGAIPWEMGLRTVAELDSGAVAVVAVDGGVAQLWQVGRNGGATRVPVPFTAFFRPRLTVCGNNVYTTAGSPDQFETLVEIHLPDGECRNLRSTFVPPPGSQTASVRPLWLQTTDGDPLQTVLSMPSGRMRGVVFDCHSGPTDQAILMPSPLSWLLNQIGLAVAQVNHLGSTGFGNAYRDALAGCWGRADVRDVVAVLDALRDSWGQSLPVFLRGESGGGLTILAIANRRPVAGLVSVHGVTDPKRLRAITHDFEAGYVDWLLGEDSADLAAEALIDGVCSPVLLLAGAEDWVVPIEQARQFADQLTRRGIDVQLEVFPGQGHGLNDPAAVNRALRAELAFYERGLSS